MDVKTAIETGDAEALRRLLAERPSRVDELILWGKNRTHPLHYISDMLFAGVLARGRELSLADALIEAGSDINFDGDGKGETPLIGAASLGAEAVGLRLLEAGADPSIRGLFGATALHWAALLGEDLLAARLIPVSDLNLEDREYHSSPLGWAIHGWSNPPAGNRGLQRDVVALLVAAGAGVQPEWLQSEAVRADSVMFALLRGHRATGDDG